MGKGCMQMLRAYIWEGESGDVVAGEIRFGLGEQTSHRLGRRTSSE